MAKRLSELPSILAVSAATSSGSRGNDANSAQALSLSKGEAIARMHASGLQQ